MNNTQICSFLLANYSCLKNKKGIQNARNGKKVKSRKKITFLLICVFSSKIGFDVAVESLLSVYRLCVRYQREWLYIFHLLLKSKLDRSITICTA